MIAFDCSACGIRMQAPPGSQGRMGRCSGCGEAEQVPWDLECEPGPARVHHYAFATRLAPLSLRCTEMLLAMASNESFREKVWRTYYSRGNNGDEHDNNQLIADILKLRHERVNLLGYDNYAQWRLEDRAPGRTSLYRTLLGMVRSVGGTDTCGPRRRGHQSRVTQSLRSVPYARAGTPASRDARRRMAGIVDLFPQLEPEQARHDGRSQTRARS